MTTLAFGLASQAQAKNYIVIFTEKSEKQYTVYVSYSELWIRGRFFLVLIRDIFVNSG